MSRFVWLLIVGIIAALVGIVALVVYRKAIFTAMKKTWVFLKGKTKRDKENAEKKEQELWNRVEKELGRKVTRKEIVFTAVLVKHMLKK